MRFLTPLLYPFSILYDVISSMRNLLYDRGVKPVARFDIPLVGVGNLSVGGTGKTPMIEYLIRLFSNDVKVATLSRGYGRKTRGIRIATDEDNAATIGDEPFQLHRKFGRSTVVAVGEERALAIPYIMHEHPDVGLVLLDDAFQHRRVQPSFQILLSDYHHLFVKDFLLPAGRLRESRRGASRADVIVVTKCPSSMMEDEMMAIEGMVRNYTDKAVFFSRISYNEILPTWGEVFSPEKIVIVTGIADAGPLTAYLKQKYEVVRHFDYPDHHDYSRKEQEAICDTASRAGAAVVTTEKDLVKLDPEVFRKGAVNLFYLPISVAFVKNGKEFDEMVLNAVRSYGQ